MSLSSANRSEPVLTNHSGSAAAAYARVQGTLLEAGVRKFVIVEFLENGEERFFEQEPFETKWYARQTLDAECLTAARKLLAHGGGHLEWAPLLEECGDERDPEVHNSQNGWAA